MIHAVAAILAPFAGPLLLGAPLLEALGVRPREDRLVFWGAAWCAGAALLGALLLVLLLLGLPASAWAFVPIVGSLLLLPLARRRRARDAGTPVASVPTSRAFLVLVGLSVLYVVFQGIVGAARPCVEGDEGNIWSRKAKALWSGVGPDFGALQIDNLHPDYPLLNPLLQAWVYALRSGIDQFDSRWPIQAFGVALVLLCAAAFRRRLHPLLAGAGLLLVVACDEFVRIGRSALADTMLATGLVLALDAWLRYRTSRDPAHRRLIALGLLLAAWSKNEAILFLLVAVVCTVVAAERGRRFVRGTALVAFAPAFLVLVVTWSFNAAYGLRNDLLGNNPTGHNLFTLFVQQFGERAPQVLARAWHEMFTFGSPQGAMLLLLPLALLLGRRGLGRGLAVPGLTLLVSLIGLHLVYIGSHLELGFHLDTSYRRVLFQLLPAFLVWLAALLAPTPADGDPR